MGKFRERMERDLVIRGYADGTRKNYLGCVQQFVAYFMRPPDQLTVEDVNRYQLYLTRERRLSWSAFNVHVCAIRFFYNVTLKVDWEIEHIPYQKTRRKPPHILSREEVGAILDALENLKHRAILATTYAAGLRRQEVVGLRVSDVDSDRMVLRINEGKGRNGRCVMLSEPLLALLREYWKRYRPKDWLFPGQDPSRPITPRAVQFIFQKARKKTGIAKPVSTHSLRHAFATHLLEDGANIRVIQRLLGHKSLRSTEIYTHVASNYLNEIASPFDAIAGTTPASSKG